MSIARMFKYGLIVISVILIFLCIHSFYSYNVSTDNFIGDFQHHFFQGNTERIWGNGNRRNFIGSRSAMSKYGPYMMAYAITVLLLFMLVFYALKRREFKLDFIGDKFTIICLLLIGLFMRIYVALSIEGFTGDISLFRNWAQSAANDLFNFYKNTPNCDYPPFYIYVLYAIGKIASIHNAAYYYTLLLKLPAIMADILSAYIIYRIANKRFMPGVSTIISALYIFNPAVFINSSAWGQVDSFFALLIIVAIYLLSERNVVLSSALFTVSVLMKPQGIIFVPILFFELINERNSKNFLKAAAAALITAAIIIIPFSAGQDPMWIYNLYAKTISEYPYASVNGFNFFSLLGANYVNSSSTLFLFSYSAWGLIFIAIITAFSWFTYIKAKSSSYAFVAALIQIAGVFTFSTGMHERYLFPAVSLALLAFLYIKDIRFLGLFLGFSITSYLNTYYVLFTEFNRSLGFIPMMVSLLTVILVIYLAKVAWDIAVLNKIHLLNGRSTAHKIHTNI